MNQVFSRYKDSVIKTPKPYAHQVEAFEKFKNEQFFGLFMDMGTGKSKIAIDICSYKFSKKEINACLIIAPNNVHSQWIKEQFPIHCKIDYESFTWLSSKKNNSLVKRRLEDFLVVEPGVRLKVLAVNVEAFQSVGILTTIGKYVKNHKCFIIIDEATRIKSPTARRSKAIHKLNKYGCRCILTGTPTAKSPFDLWSQFQFLRANYFECNYFIFQHRYGVMMRGINIITGGKYFTLIDEKTYNIAAFKIKKLKEVRLGNKLMPDDYEALAVILGISEKNIHFIEANPNFSRYKRLDELKEYIANDVFTVTKAKCLDLPPKVYEKIFVDMPKDQRQIYDNLKTQLLAEYEGQELTVLNKIALTTRLMQICGGFFPFTDDKGVKHIKPIGKSNAKLEVLIADMEETGNEQIIIWAQFINELELLYKTLSKDFQFSSALYYGKTEQSERERIIKDFKGQKIKIFIGNPQTAGFGLNLQTCTLQYFFSNSFRTENRLQAEDRSHRIGVKKTCVYKDIIMKNSIDESIFKNIATGKSLNDFFKSKSLKEILETNENGH